MSCFSAYQVVVVEEDGSRHVKRRELGTVDCFPTPNSHNEAQAKGASHYYTAELAPSSLPEATPFTVGDNHTYNGYWNSPLDPTKNYLIYFQATSNFRGVRTITMSFFLCYSDTILQKIFPHLSKSLNPGVSITSMATCRLHLQIFVKECVAFRSSVNSSMVQ